MMHNIDPDQWEKLYQNLIETKQDFEEVETRKKRYLIWNKCKFYRDPKPNKLNMCDVGIIYSTKKEIQNNLKKVSLPDNLQKDYFLAVRKPWTYSQTPNVNFYFPSNNGEATTDRTKEKTQYKGHAIQIDINAAYLTAVKNLGLLSEKTFSKFFTEEENEKQRAKKAKSSRHRGHAGEVYKYSKDARLIAVGTLAQDKTIHKYISGEKVSQERQYNEIEANVFFSAAAEIGKIMIDILENCKGFFYWVDAIFISPEYQKQAEEMLKKAGYNYHTKKLLISQDGGNFETIDTETGELKTYNVPSGKISGQIIFKQSAEFTKDIFEEYKQILKLIDSKELNVNKEKARAEVSKVLRLNYNIESDIDLHFLSIEAVKAGLVLEDIIKLETTIKEEYKDAIFQNDILKVVILKKLDNIANRQALPGHEEQLQDGGKIEREFYTEYY
jgi:hypothetical protein